MERHLAVPPHQHLWHCAPLRQAPVGKGGHMHLLRRFVRHWVRRQHGTARDTHGIAQAVGQHCLLLALPSTQVPGGVECFHAPATTSAPASCDARPRHYFHCHACQRWLGRRLHSPAGEHLLLALAETATTTGYPTNQMSPPCPRPQTVVVTTSAPVTMASSSTTSSEESSSARLVAGLRTTDAWMSTCVL